MKKTSDLKSNELSPLQQRTIVGGNGTADSNLGGIITNGTSLLPKKHSIIIIG